MTDGGWCLAKRSVAVGGLPGHRDDRRNRPLGVCWPSDVMKTGPKRWLTRLAREAVDLFGLAGAESFIGVETPDAFEQSLTPEDLVDAGDAAGEAVGDIEERGVGIGGGDDQTEQIRRDAVCPTGCVVAGVEQL